jgi:hypothetical protein
MQISGVSSHLALQALFTQSSPLHEPVLQAFPFPSTLGEVTLHLLSQTCVFVYSSHGKWVFPPLLWRFPPTTTFISFSAPDYWAVLLLLPAAVFVYSSCGRWVFPPFLWSFPPSATLTSFPTPGCWSCYPAPAGAFPAWPSLFIYSSGKDSLPRPFSTQCTSPSFPSVFIVLTAYYSFYLFSLGGGQSVQGAMLIWPRVVCGSTTVPLTSPCPCLPKPSGHGRLDFVYVKWRFSVPTGCVEWSKFCLFSVVLPARCVSSVSPRFHYRRHAFCFLPLATILESP